MARLDVESGLTGFERAADVSSTTAENTTVSLGAHGLVALNAGLQPFGRVWNFEQPLGRRDNINGQLVVAHVQTCCARGCAHMAIDVFQ